MAAGDERQTVNQTLSHPATPTHVNGDSTPAASKEANAAPDAGSYGRRTTRKVKVKVKVRKAVKKAALIVGLLALNLGYVVLGGLVFSALESPNEFHACNASRDTYLANENATVQLVLDIVSRLDGISTYSPSQMLALKASFQDLLDEFALPALSNNYNPQKTDCDLLGTDVYPLKWSFMPAALFSMTIISTIGYGNIAPVTSWGRFICIPYAILGISVYFFFLATFAPVVSAALKAVYSACCCLGCLRVRRHREQSWPKPPRAVAEERRFAAAATSGSVSLIVVRGADGDGVGHKEDVEQAAAAAASEPRSPPPPLREPQSIVADSEQHGARPSVGDDGGGGYMSLGGPPLRPPSERDIVQLVAAEAQVKMSEAKASVEAAAEQEEKEEEDDDSDEQEEKPTIPVIVCLGIFAALLVAGGVFFRQWETWTLEEAIYFSFVTLSTIGFGDFVPGTRPDRTAAEEAAGALTGILFIFLGLTVVSVLFDLMVRAVVANFKWLEEKCGGGVGGGQAE